MRLIVLVAVLGLWAGVAVAQDWGKIATVSTTMGVSGSRLCVGEASRGDIGCPAYAPSLTTAGDVSVSGNLSAAKFIGDGSGLTGVGSNVSVTTGLSGSIVYRDQFGSLFASNGFSISSTTGSVGIGSGAPVSLGNSGLYASGQVYSGSSIFSTNSFGFLSAGTTSYGWYGGNEKISGDSTTKYIAITTSGTEAMRIVSSGFVGIGTAQPSATLHVLGSARFGAAGSGGVLTIIDSGNVNYTLSPSATAPNVFGIRSNTNSNQAYNFYGTGAGSVFMGVNMSAFPSGTLHVSGTAVHTSWTALNMASAPTAPLEVSGTVSATRFVGNGSGLTGIAASTDRLVSGSVNAIAEQTSGTVRVSGTLALVNSGSEVCDAKTWYSMRINPSTGQMQMCRP